MLNYIDEQDQIENDKEAVEFMNAFNFEDVEIIEDPIEFIDENTQDLAQHVEDMKYKVGDMVKLKSGKIIEFQTKTKFINIIKADNPYEGRREDQNKYDKEQQAL